MAQWHEMTASGPIAVIGTLLLTAVNASDPESLLVRFPVLLLWLLLLTTALSFVDVLSFFLVVQLATPISMDALMRNSLQEMSSDGAAHIALVAEDHTGEQLVVSDPPGCSTDPELTVEVRFPCRVPACLSTMVSRCCVAASLRVCSALWTLTPSRGGLCGFAGATRFTTCMSPTVLL